MTDKRLNPNHKDYKGNKILPKKLTTIAPVAGMWLKPKKNTMRVSELLYGETATAFAETEDFYILQSNHDNYVAYGKKNDFTPTKNQAKMQVQVKSAPLFAKADIKSPILGYLSGGSLITTPKLEKNYYKIKARLHGKSQTAYIHKSHIGKKQKLKPSINSILQTARSFLGLPYIWGGRSYRGVDCSGLVQLVLMAHSIPCPRDSDMQANSIGKPVKTMKKGDLIFWHGHVGFYTGTHLLHAYGGTCLVQEDKTSDIFPRLTEATDADICAIRRLI